MRGYEKINEFVYAHEKDDVILIIGKENIVQFQSNCLDSISRLDSSSTRIKIFTDGKLKEHTFLMTPITKVIEGLRKIFTRGVSV